MTDLCNPTQAEIRSFVNRVLELALLDQRLKKGRRSGRNILEEVGVEGWRRGHERMATGLYNATRWTLDAAAREKAQSDL